MSKYPEWECANCTCWNKHLDARCQSCGNMKDRTRNNSNAQTPTSEPARSRRTSGEQSKITSPFQYEELVRAMASKSTKQLQMNELKEIMDVAKAAGEDIEPGSWECLHCTRMNPPFMERCCACFAEPPPEYWPHEETIRNLTAEPEEATLVPKGNGSGDPCEEALQESLSWICHVCTFKNKVEFSNCNACLSNRPDEVHVPTPEEQMELHRLLKQQLSQTASTINRPVSPGEDKGGKGNDNDDDDDDDDDEHYQISSSKEYNQSSDMPPSIAPSQEVRQPPVNMRVESPVSTRVESPVRRRDEREGVEDKTRNSARSRSSSLNMYQNIGIRKLLIDAMDDLSQRKYEDLMIKLTYMAENGWPILLKEVSGPLTFAETCFLEITVCAVENEFVFYKRFKVSDTVKDLKNLLFIRYNILPQRQNWIFGSCVVPEDRQLSQCGVDVSPMLFPVRVFVEGELRWPDGTIHPKWSNLNH